MALALSDVQHCIRILASDLKLDRDIRDGIRRITATARKCVSLYTGMLNNEGQTVLLQKTILVTSSHPMEIEVVKMVSALEAVIENLKAIKAEVIAMETEIHSEVETCRSRKAKHVTEKINKQSIVGLLKEDMHSMDDQISDYNSDYKKLEESVKELETRTKDLEEAAKKKKTNGIVNAVLGGVGLVLAPFTGGVSLALAATGGITAGINFNSERECREAASKLREDAEKKRKTARELVARKKSLQRQNSAVQSQVDDLGKRLDNLKLATQSLEGMTAGLLGFVKEVDRVLQVFQDMGASFKAAVLETNAFTIIQNAFSRNPEKLEGYAQRHLNKLKTTWDAVEEILVNNGHVSVQYGDDSHDHRWKDGHRSRDHKFQNGRRSHTDGHKSHQDGERSHQSSHSRPQDGNRWRQRGGKHNTRRSHQQTECLKFT